MKLHKVLRVSAFFFLFFVIGSSKAFSSGFVQLYEDKDFKGRAVTVKSGTDIPEMKKASTDDGKSDFDNKATSVKYNVPAGWQAVLYEDANFQKRITVLMGAGDTQDLDKFAGKCSSLRWESTGEQKSAAGAPAAGTPAPAGTPPPAAATPAATPTTAPTKK